MDDFQLTFGGAGESLHDTFLRFALDCIFDENAKEIVVAILTVTAALYIDDSKAGHFRMSPRSSSTA